VTPPTAISQNSILNIILPSEITLVELSVACTVTIGVDSTNLSSVSIISSTAPVQISITDAFASGDYTTTGTSF
jgi:hypothetical protein